MNSPNAGHIGREDALEREGVPPSTTGDIWDVVVIGAGPAGAVAARQLASEGLRVLLVERKALHAAKGLRIACVSTAAVELLERIGLRETLRQLAGVELRQFHVRGAAGELRVALPAGVAISRAALDAGLAQAGVELGAALWTQTLATVGKGTLPAAQQQAIVLTKIEGLSMVEASARTGVSVAALKVQVHRGLKRLAELVRNDA